MKQKGLNLSDDAHQSLYNLNVHDFSFSSSELVINPEIFPDILVSDYLEIYQKGVKNDARLVLQVESVAPIKGGRLQISLLKSVADSFGLQSWSNVIVKKVDPKTAAADFVEFTIKDQFIPRADMLRFKKMMFGSAAFRGKVFKFLGVRASVRELTRLGHPAVSGILTESTNFNFRSRSSRIFWLVQISVEMFEYAPCGQLYLEIFINDFVTKLLQKWKAIQATHSLTVVFFSRTFFLYKVDPGMLCSGLNQRTVRIGGDGKAYEDSYKIVVENEICVDPEKLTLQLRKEMMAFPRLMGWCVPTSITESLRKENLEVKDWPGASDFMNCVNVGVPSYAAQGNFLEAINVTLNVLEKHYMDRDLCRIGNSIVALSACTGVFEVDANLAAITKQRMMDNGIGMDMVSLSQPPLHTAPLFIYTDDLSRSKGGRRYEVPHWMNLSFAIGPDERDALSPHGISEILISSNYSSDTKQIRLPMPKLLNAPLFSTDEAGNVDLLSYLPHSLSVLLGLETSSICSDIGHGKNNETGILHMWGSYHPLVEPAMMVLGGEKKISPAHIYTLSREHRLSDDFETCMSVSSAGTVASSILDNPVSRRTVGSIDKASRRPYPDLDDHIGPPQPQFEPRLRSISDNSVSEGRLRKHSRHIQRSQSRNFHSSSSLNDYSQQKIDIGVVKQINVPEVFDAYCREHDALVFVDNSKKHNDRQRTRPPCNVFKSRDQATSAFGREVSAVKFQAECKIDNKTVGSNDSDEKQLPYLPIHQEKRAIKLHNEKIGCINKLGQSIESHPQEPFGLPKSAVPQTLSFTGNLKYNENQPIETLMSLHDEVKSKNVSNVNQRNEENFFQKASNSAIQMFLSWGQLIDSNFNKSPTNIAPSGSVTSRTGTTNLSSGKKKSNPNGIYKNSLANKNLRKQENTSKAIATPAHFIKKGQKHEVIHGEERDKVGIMYSPTVSPHMRRFQMLIDQWDASNSSVGMPRLSRSLEEKYDSKFSDIRCLRTHTEANTTGQERLFNTNCDNGGLGQSIDSDRSKQEQSLPSSVLHRRNTFTRGSEVSILNEVARNMPLIRRPTIPKSTEHAQATAADLELHRQTRLINPFKRQDEEQLLRIRTYNRRRWSHVFPAGEQEFKQMPGPIWKSLCQPALLPLTTDYLPNREVLAKNYTESFYTLTLPDQDDPITKHYSSHLDLLEELVCQRVSQDFQLVESDVVSGGAVKNKNTALTGSRHRQYNSAFGSKAEASSEQKVAYTLSMGHRIHSIKYDEQTKQVEVRRYMSRYGSNAMPGNMVSYKYCLWQGIEEKFQAVQQVFLKYPSPEYSWNYLDELVCGFNDNMIENTKYRRILFAVIPPQLASNEEAYFGKMQKLCDYINSKAEQEKSFSFKFKNSLTKVAKVECDNNDDLLRSTLQSIKVNVKEGRAQKDRYEWLEVALDGTCDVAKVVHININWVVCSGSSVSDYVLALRRRTQQIGLKLIQIPQYALGSDINVHPFITHAYVRVSSKAVREAMDKLLCSEKFNFVRDNSVRTNWKEFGVEEDETSFLPFTSGLATSLNHKIADYPLETSVQTSRKIRNEKKSRAYCHRSGHVFVREAPRGFVFIENRHMNPLECRLCTLDVLNMFKKCVQNAEFVYQLVIDIVELALSSDDMKHS